MVVVFMHYMFVNSSDVLNKVLQDLELVSFSGFIIQNIYTVFAGKD